MPKSEASVDSCGDPYECGADIELFEITAAAQEIEAWVVVLRVRWLTQGVPANPIAEVGDCGLYDGDPILPDAEIEHLDAGIVTIRGTAFFPEIMFTIGEDGRYESDLPSMLTDLFGEGDALEFVVVGGPDFSAGSVTLSAPTDATLTVPTVSGGVTAPVSRADDLNMSWPVPAFPGDMIFVSARSDTGYRVSCVVPDVGSMTISSELLALMPPGDARLRFSRVRTIETVNLDGQWIRANAWSILMVETTLQ